MTIADFDTSRFGSVTFWTGILLVVVGFAGIVLPEAMSIGAELFISSLMIFGAVLWGYHTYLYSRHNIIDWIKPAVLLLVAGLMIFYPLHGVAVMGMLLAVYLLMDSFGSFALAQATHPMPGWGWMAFNGVVSLVLAFLFLFGWPETSLWLVGLYVSISLLFDGFAMIFIGHTVRKALI